MKFADAYQRLEEIHTLIQSDTIVDIDQLVKLQKEAKELYEFCQQTLKKHEKTLNDTKDLSDA